ncbi:DUF5659 domain-containing protein [Paenibacillus polymyxa]|uniref:DUF5659 domain-containing protein n=2 Tax=Paenibacillus polymyxa TaxID=1406 RepID=UPI00338EE650
MNMMEEEYLKYICDINLVSYLLLNGLEYRETRINPTNNKLQFYFERSEYLNELIEQFKSSPFKQFSRYQNQVKKVLHTMKR